MTYDNISEQTWQDLLLGRLDCNFEFLALKILLTRLRFKLQQDNSPASLRQCVAEVKGLFEKMGNLPKAQEDLKKLSEAGR